MLGGLLPRFRGAELALTYVVLVNLALVLPGLCVPTFGRVFVDDIVVGGAHGWLISLLLIMAMTALFRGVLSHLLRHYLGRLETRLALSMASKFLWHLLKLPYVFFQQRYAGDLSSRVNTNERVARLLSGDLAQSVLSCVMIVFYGILMMTYDRLLCAIAVALALLNLFAVSQVRRRRTDENQRLLADRSQLYGVMVRGLQIIETLKASGGEDDFFALWGGYQAKVAGAEQRMGVMSQLLSTVPSLLNSISTAAILGIGALRVMDGHLTMGQLIAFQALSASFLQPVTSLVSLGSTMQEVEGDLRRLDDVLRYKPDPTVRLESEEEAKEQPAAGKRPARLPGSVEFRGVKYGYSRLEPPLIESFNLAIKPGSRVALVGGSGSGKSTVAKLLAGLFEPWSGEIFFDGQSRQEILREILCNSVAVIDQDVVLFEGTVRDNLTMWDSTIPESAIVAAAKDAAIHDDIIVRPGGYNARVEEGGRNFSGGQRQRLEIARALVRSPSVLIIDEGTSALDPLTELVVERNLRRRGCTCLVVAHRLSTIRDCDEILVLERGQVIERGTHASLLRENGRYAELVRSA
jgi:NHLM bacteriocin system ABC transporter peptidase/ATP-binding protein